MQTRCGVTGVVLLAALVGLSLGACAKKPPVAQPPEPVKPATASTPAPTVPTPVTPPRQPERVREPVVVPPAALKEDKVATSTLEEINRDSPLKPAFFDYDSAAISPEAQQVLNANADELKKRPTWTITIEGHCDERGTAEYNLALGDRRAVAAQAYLVSLGVAAGRIRTVSYGKEFPFDPGHDEQAWTRNRRDHFVVTQK